MKRWKGLLVAVLVVACSTDGASTTQPPSAAEETTTTTLVTSTTTTSTIPATTTSVSEVPSAPDGYETFDGSDNGFFVALPDTWITLDLGEDDFEALLDGYRGEMPPELADQLPTLIDQGIKLFAVDTFGDDPEFLSNVNVGVYERGPIDDIDLFEQVVPQQVELFGADLVTLQRVQIPSGEALRAVYDLPIGGGYVAKGQQYWIASETSVYVVTFTDTEDNSHSSTFGEIIETFQPTD